jgi:flagellar motility protein MotE (MotC chaperone)
VWRQGNHTIPRLVNEFKEGLDKQRTDFKEIASIARTDFLSQLAEQRTNFRDQLEREREFNQKQTLQILKNINK